MSKPENQHHAFETPELNFILAVVFTSALGALVAAQLAWGGLPHEWLGWPSLFATWFWWQFYRARRRRQVHREPERRDDAA